MAKKLKNTDYLFLSAYLRAKENGMLTRERAERMINARTAKDAAKVLEECGYGDMSSVTLSGIGERVNGKRASVMKDLETVVPDKSVLDLFRIKYDYHNLKTAIKAEAMGLNGESLLSDAGRYGKDVFLSEYRKEDGGLFSEPFRAAMLDAKDTLSVQVHPDDTYGLANMVIAAVNNNHLVLLCSAKQLIFRTLAYSFYQDEDTAFNYTMCVVKNAKDWSGTLTLAAVIIPLEIRTYL